MHATRPSRDVLFHALPRGLSCQKGGPCQAERVLPCSSALHRRDETRSGKNSALLLRGILQGPRRAKGLLCAFSRLPASTRAPVASGFQLWLFDLELVLEVQWLPTRCLPIATSAHSGWGIGGWTERPKPAPELGRLRPLSEVPSKVLEILLNVRASQACCWGGASGSLCWPLLRQEI